MVSGFVELSGRRIETHAGFRSQYGRVVGPLRISLPAPPPWLGALSGRVARPYRVLVGDRSYRSP